MGRELKRVALDFDWPLNEVWTGFINPHHKACEACEGGTTYEGWWIDSLGRFIELWAEACESGRDYGRPLHPHIKEWSGYRRLNAPEDVIQKAREAEKKTGEERSFWAVYEAWLSKGDHTMPMNKKLHDVLSKLKYDVLLKAAGIEDVDEWYRCPVCRGSGVHPSVKEKYDAWKDYEPPSGEGWQLWETVSEGSPVSPVFPTQETFIAYLIGEGYSEKAAKRFCEVGSVPSMVITHATLFRDIETCAMDNEPE